MGGPAPHRLHGTGGLPIGGGCGGQWGGMSSSPISRVWVRSHVRTMHQEWGRPPQESGVELSSSAMGRDEEGGTKETKKVGALSHIAVACFIPRSLVQKPRIRMFLCVPPQPMTPWFKPPHPPPTRDCCGQRHTGDAPVLLVGGPEPDRSKGEGRGGVDAPGEELACDKKTQTLHVWNIDLH